MRSALCARFKGRLPSQMLQGNDISKDPNGAPHSLNSPATMTRMRSTSVLRERTPVELLAAFKLTVSPCACVHVLPIGEFLNSLPPLFDQRLQPRGPRTPLLRLSTLLSREVRAMQ